MVTFKLEYGFTIVVSKDYAVFFVEIEIAYFFQVVFVYYRESNHGHPKGVFLPEPSRVYPRSKTFRYSLR